MDIKFFYDIPFVKEIIGYFLIPFLVFIIICCIVLLTYSAKYKDHESPIYKYKINLASLIISIFLTAVFLAILIGFSYAFKLQLDAQKIETPLAYLVVLSPIIPAFALIVLMVKTIRLVLQKPKKQDVLKENSKEEVQEQVEEVVEETLEEETAEIMPEKEQAKEEKEDPEIELL